MCRMLSRMSHTVTSWPQVRQPTYGRVSSRPLPHNALLLFDTTTCLPNWSDLNIAVSFRILLMKQRRVTDTRQRNGASCGLSKPASKCIHQHVYQILAMFISKAAYSYGIRLESLCMRYRERDLHTDFSTAGNLSSISPFPPMPYRARNPKKLYYTTMRPPFHITRFCVEFDDKGNQVAIGAYDRAIRI